MNYSDFITSIEKYGELYLSGLKEKANGVLKNAVCGFEALSADEKNTIIRRFLTELCDEDKYSFLFSRGNGMIPYPLILPLSDWLSPRCEQDMMPELRWFYEVFKCDKQRSECACDCIQRAYLSKACDKKTLNLKFELNILALELGLHELPLGLLISKEEFERTVAECEDIILKASVPIAQAEHYVQLKNRAEEAFSDIE